MKSNPQNAKGRGMPSTIDGEMEVLRVEIKDIQYDAPEQNLFRMGRLYEGQGRFEEALNYYQRATEANPRYKEASDAAIIVAEKIRISQNSGDFSSPSLLNIGAGNFWEGIFTIMVKMSSLLFETGIKRIIRWIRCEYGWFI